jgi:hypothetical protein
LDSLHTILKHCSNAKIEAGHALDPWRRLHVRNWQRSHFRWWQSC